MQKENDINLKEEVSRRYEQLHPDVKAALVSVDTAGAVYEIGKKFGLNIEKTGYLADVIGYTIIGLLPVADFINNLKDTIGIDGAKAEEISREVNAKIFLAIREQLKKTHGEKWDERAFREPTTSNLQPTTTPTIKPTTDNQQPTTPTTPKSPWEIKPDGFQKTAAEVKSVIPSQPKLITDNRQQTTSPELPKTREAPQPAPVVRAPGVLREITPLRIDAQDKKPEVSITKSVLRDETKKTEAGITKPVLRVETAKAVPPENLPFAQEVKKLTQIPELEKPAVQKQPEAPKPPQPQQEVTLQPPQPAPAPKPQVPQEVQQPKPQASLQAPKQEQKYAADPYREPIE